jgi:hypothetical protein
VLAGYIAALTAPIPNASPSVRAFVTGQLSKLAICVVKKVAGPFDDLVEPVIDTIQFSHGLDLKAKTTAANNQSAAQQHHMLGNKVAAAIKNSTAAKLKFYDDHELKLARAHFSLVEGQDFQQQFTDLQQRFAEQVLGVKKTELGADEGVVVLVSNGTHSRYALAKGLYGTHGTDLTFSTWIDDDMVAAALARQQMIRPEMTQPKVVGPRALNSTEPTEYFAKRQGQ